MKIYKEINIDLEVERERIRVNAYTGRQKENLLKLVKLFEEGEFQKCLDHIHANFVYDEEFECHENEYICGAIADILINMGNGIDYIIKKDSK